MAFYISILRRLGSKNQAKYFSWNASQIRNFSNSAVYVGGVIDLIQLAFYAMFSAAFYASSERSLS